MSIESFLRPSAFFGELVPSQLALKLIEEHFGLDTLMHLAQSGSHNLNPYHNTVHELQHVYWSNACGVNSFEKDTDTFNAELLILASLFHDHNHTGGKYDDRTNITRALGFVSQHLPEPSLIKLIMVTEFLDGKFTYEPQTFEEKCMRDADLMAIYSREGRRLLIGLFTELGTPLKDMKKDDVIATIQRNRDFLTNAEMFTQFGQRMKDEHLEHCLQEFDHQVWSRFRYEMDDRKHDDTND